jgi:flavin reductase (DIM6/NTAB) family NADH-FMN oxidoreductase RutF
LAKITTFALQFKRILTVQNGKKKDKNMTKEEFVKEFRILKNSLMDDVFNPMSSLLQALELDSKKEQIMEELYAVTAGTEEHYNSMVGSGGGMGLLFKKPVTWCVFQQGRYTLELILKEQTYTISYFPCEYKKQMMFLGSKTGRGSNKMKEVELTGIKTPAGNMAFKEAGLILECKLIQVTTPNLNDFYTQEAKDWVNEMYKDPNEIRKYVFGEITHVWVKKFEK